MPRSAIRPLRLAGALAAILSAAVPVSSLAAGASSPTAASRHGAPRARAAIVGGTPARGGAFVSVAEVFDVLGAVTEECTGTVVSPSLILTAGHCVESIETGTVHRASGFSVVTGGVDGVESQVSAVSGAIVYEGFRRKVDEGDAALLVLSTPTTAPPVTLGGSDSAALRAGTTATIAGWGEMRDEQRQPTGELQAAVTVVQSDRWCRHSAPPFYAGAEICTIDTPSYATGACFGDSGGPLFAPSVPGEAPVEIGVAVHIYGRCSTRRPSVFTSVAQIAGWVGTWIAAYDSKQPTPTTPAPGSPTPAAS
jgi:secreted trypsin-like serine protease